MEYISYKYKIRIVLVGITILALIPWTWGQDGWIIACIQIGFTFFVLDAALQAENLRRRRPAQIAGLREACNIQYWLGILLDCALRSACNINQIDQFQWRINEDLMPKHYAKIICRLQGTEISPLLEHFQLPWKDALELDGEKFKEMSDSFLNRYSAVELGGLVEAIHEFNSGLFIRLMTNQQNYRRMADMCGAHMPDVHFQSSLWEYLIDTYNRIYLEIEIVSKELEYKVNQIP